MKKSLFEGFLGQLLARLGDLILLQMAFLITSIPVFTIGAGLTAMYAVCRRLRKESVSFVLKLYLTEFKENFKKSTIMWMLILLAGGVFYADARFCSQQAGGIFMILQIVSYILMIAVFMTAVFVFPQAAWFENSVVQYFKNALPLAAAHPSDTGKLLILFIMAFIAAEVLRPLMFIIGISGTVYLAAGILMRAWLPEELKTDYNSAE